MKKVIFDTDIGIDDAMALLFLHHARDAELQAVTTVAGNASIDDTTRNARYVCDRFTIDAPVHRGAAGSLGSALGEGFPDFVHGKNGLGNIEFAEPEHPEHKTSASDAIIEMAKAQPGELSIVAVGRLTNIAVALQQCHELPALLREIVVMGGVFMRNGQSGNVSPVAEANMAGDPMAADFVMGSGASVTIVGLDVTQLTTMDEAFVGQLAKTAGDSGAFIHHITRHYFDFYESIKKQRACPIHDSSAVAYLLRPDLYEIESGPVRVVDQGLALGQTIMGRDNARYQIDGWEGRSAVNACVNVDADAVKALYLSTLRSAR
ncbi:MAG: nucleoside hydrolase [Pseudomonadota bacterium]